MRDKIEESLSFSDKISSYVKVKVSKPQPDALTSICGERVQTDKDGNEFFIIPEHAAKYQKEIHPVYTFSKGFLPQDAYAKLNAESNVNTPVIGEEPVAVPIKAADPLPPIPPRKSRGNPNWGKKRTMDETGFDPIQESHG